MRITFQFTPQNLQEAYKLHFRKSSPLAGRGLQLFGFLSLWSGLLMILAVRNQANFLINYGLVLNGVVAILIHYIQMRTLGKRLYKRYSAFHEPFQYEIQEEGLTLLVEDKTAVMPWESFEKAVLSDYIILLYPNKRTFYYLTKAEFSSDDFATVKSWVKEKVKNVK